MLRNLQNQCNSVQTQRLCVTHKIKLKHVVSELLSVSEPLQLLNIAPHIISVWGGGGESEIDFQATVLPKLISWKGLQWETTNMEDIIGKSLIRTLLPQLTKFEVDLSTFNRNTMQKEALTYVWKESPCLKEVSIQSKPIVDICGAESRNDNLIFIGSKSAFLQLTSIFLLEMNML